MSNALASKSCKPCEGGASPLRGEALDRLTAELGEGWRVVKADHLEKEWRFKDFRAALAFTNRVGELAEQEGHHPEIFLTWGRVRIQLRTHSINGLSENDFILGAKIDNLG
jgi:4a-hydroxytetrahydrobiopterin dehydratase